MLYMQSEMFSEKKWFGAGAQRRYRYGYEASPVFCRPESSESLQ